MTGKAECGVHISGYAMADDKVRDSGAGPRCGPGARPGGQTRASANRTAGEEEAYFELRKLGYIIVARNYRSPRRRGEIDLIGWDGDVICFVEVKTRTTRDVKPAEASVDRDKQYEIRAVAREYLRRLPSDLNWRFDVASVYFENAAGGARFELFKNAFPVT